MVYTVNVGCTSYEPRVAVLGVGGAGCNIVASLYNSLVPVDTIAVNTDKAALLSTSADRKIYICKEVTKGEGTFGNAKLGKLCAQVHEDEIRQAIVGHDAIFLVAGLGGGTGTGAVSVIAELCHEMGIMTFCIAIEPFSFEGSRNKVALEGLRTLRVICPNIIKFKNDLILEQLPNVSVGKAFSQVNACIKKVIVDSVGMMPSYFREELESIKSESEKREHSVKCVSNISDANIRASD
jgi:cell division protein FtsZ